MSSKSKLIQSGYYGKIPSVGDFISNGLSNKFIQPWDKWLQEIILTGQSELADHWSNYFISCPTYRFALSPGICGNSAWVGVVRPSVDKAGRHFPLTFATEVSRAQYLTRTFTSNTIVLNEVETILLSTQHDSFIQNDFEQKISAIGEKIAKCTTQLDIETHIHESSFGGKIGIRLDFNDEDDLNDEYWGTIIHAVLSETCDTYSIWSSHGNETNKAGLVVCDGLPPPANAVSFFSGDWVSKGWRVQYRDSNSITDCEVEDLNGTNIIETELNEMDSTVNSPIYIDLADNDVDSETKNANTKNISDDSKFPWD